MYRNLNRANRIRRRQGTITGNASSRLDILVKFQIGHNSATRPSTLRQINFNLLTQYKHHNEDQDRQNRKVIKVRQNFTTLDLLIRVLIAFNGINRTRVKRHTFRGAYRRQSFHIFTLLLTRRVQGVRVTNVIQERRFVLNNLIR